MEALGLDGHKELFVLKTFDRRNSLASVEGMPKLAEMARRGRVTVHLVDLAPDGRIIVPGAEIASHTGGLTMKLGARRGDVMLDRLRARAACRFILTFIPKDEKKEEQYRRVRIIDREGRFDASHPQWYAARRDGALRNTASRWLLSEADRYVTVKIGEVSARESIGRSTLASSIPVELTHKRHGEIVIDRIIVGVFKGSRVEFEESYSLASEPKTKH